MRPTVSQITVADCPPLPYTPSPHSPPFETPHVPPQFAQDRRRGPASSMFCAKRGRSSNRLETGESPCQSREAVEGGCGREHGSARAAAREEYLCDAGVGDIRGDVRCFHGWHGRIFQGAALSTGRMRIVQGRLHVLQKGLSGRTN